MPPYGGFLIRSISEILFLFCSASESLSFVNLFDFTKTIMPVASLLGIPPENIFANQLLFGNSGEYLVFDTSEPTSRSGGKATAVEKRRKAHGYKLLVMIGDGATDLKVIILLSIRNTSI